MTTTPDGADAVELDSLLAALAGGDADAFDRLVPLVYDELKRLARRHRRGPDTTLDTTALVHETYLKLEAASAQRYADRQHLLAVAARAMRQLVVDHARERQARKRGGDQQRVTLDDPRLAATGDPDSILDIDQALRRLATVDPRLPQLVELRFFAGCSEEEAARALGISLRTAQRDWMRARAWLEVTLAS